MRILLVPSGFKESISAEKAAICMKNGIRRVLPKAKVVSLPLVDGGEGFVNTMVKWTQGSLSHQLVTGPIRQQTEASIGFLGYSSPKTAVIEVASAAGLKWVPRDQRNPERTTSYGVGELIRAALDQGAERILIGCGDSGTHDGGIGMAQALGVRFLDPSGHRIDARQGAHVIHKIASIDLSTIDPRLRQVPIDVACNWHNILCGPHGVTRVFGRQKGATEKQLLQLERSFEHLASLIEKKTGRAVDQMPGGGASGGLGAGLHGLFGARLHPRYDIIMKQLDLDRYLRETDLVITAEGSIDFQTPRGKIPAEVATRAKRYGKPVIAIAGMIGEGARLNYRHGIDVYTSILQSPVSLEQAMEKTEAWLEDCAESLMRTLWIGQELAATQYQRQVASGQ